jgi:cell division protein FtsQ
MTRRKPGTIRRVLLRAGIRVLAGGAVSAAVIGAWVHLTRTDALAIRTIAIEGTTSERADEIRALLNLKTRDVAPGTAPADAGTTSLLFLDLAETRARVESHPWVAKAVVKRELPDTLRIVVEEREPRLVLALDRLYYVDVSGTPFKALQPGDKYDLPVLTGLTREDLLGRAAVAREAIHGALDLVAALSAPEAKGALSVEDVSEISWDAVRGYAALTVRGNELIRFGFGNWVEKLSRLKEVREARQGNAKGMGMDARTIDLTYASRVIVAR